MPQVPEDPQEAQQIQSTVNHIYEARDKKERDELGDVEIQKQQSEKPLAETIRSQEPQPKSIKPVTLAAPKAPPSPWKVMDSRDNNGVREETALLDVGSGVIVRSSVGIGSGAHQSVSIAFVPGAEIINGNKIRQK